MSIGEKISQKFAEIALNCEHEYITDNTSIENKIFIGSMIGILVGGIGGVQLIDQDGNQHADKIASDYKEVLADIIEKKSLLQIQHGQNLADDSSQSYIINSLSGNVAESDATPSKEQAKAEWAEFMRLTEIFAADVQRDPNLAEYDARDMIEDFEDNVMPLEKLGYNEEMFPSKLRECQAIYDDAKSINTCTTDDEVEQNLSAANWFLFGSVIASTITYPFAPMLFNTVVSRNRNRLEKMKNPKKY